jgi:hypothetical protein
MKRIIKKYISPVLIFLALAAVSSFCHCGGDGEAIVKIDGCLKVYQVPRQNSRSIDCLSNFTEVKVLSVERRDVIIKGKRGNFVVISYSDDEGNRRVGYAFDAHLYYPRMSLQAIIMITIIITLIVSGASFAGFTVIQRYMKSRKKARQKQAKGKKAPTKIIKGISKKTKIILLIASGAILAALFITIFFLNIRGCSNDFFANSIDITDLVYKKKQLRRYVGKYVKSMDYLNPATRDFAARLAAQYPGKFSISQICSIYDHVRDNWKYVDDPEGFEYISPASRTIENGFIGDCDDYAVLLASLMKAVGGQTRIIYAIGKRSSHAYAEVKIPIDDKTIEFVNQHYRNVMEKLLDVNRIEKLHAHRGYGGDWLNLDWSSKIPGGKYFTADYFLVIYPNGYFFEKKFLKE